MTFWDDYLDFVELKSKNPNTKCISNKYDKSKKVMFAWLARHRE
jgi:hypothetical protein